MRVYIYCIIYALLFSQGLWDLAGNFQLLGAWSILGDGAVPRYLAEGIIILMFVEKVYFSLKNNLKFKITGLSYFIFFAIVSFLSSLFNGSSSIETLLFFERVSVYYFLFLLIINEQLSQKKIRKIIFFLAILFVIQLIAVGIKYYFLGISEKGGIGTISLTAGSLSTILPMIAAAYLSALYIFKKNFILFILILGYLAFGIIGHKRAIILFLPMIILIVQGLYISYEKSFIYIFKNKRILKNLCLYTVLSLIFVYFTIRLNPTLNPENEIGGSFDISYVMEYAQSYTTRSGVENVNQTSRLVATQRSLDVVSQEGVFSIFFGIGPGKIIESALLPSNKNVLWENYGIGYGGRIGIIWLFIQTGFLGVLTFLAFIIYLYFKVKRLYKRSLDWRVKALTLGCAGTFIVFFIDFMAYSSTMINEAAMASVFFSIPAFLLQSKIIDNQK